MSALNSVKLFLPKMFSSSGFWDTVPSGFPFASGLCFLQIWWFLFFLSHPTCNCHSGISLGGERSLCINLPQHFNHSIIAFESLFLDCFHQHHKVTLFKVQFFPANYQFFTSLFLLMASSLCNIPTLLFNVWSIKFWRMPTVVWTSPPQPRYRTVLSVPFVVNP